MTDEGLRNVPIPQERTFEHPIPRQDAFTQHTAGVPPAPHHHASAAGVARYRSDTIAAMYLSAEWGDLLQEADQFHARPPTRPWGPHPEPGAFYRRCAAAASRWLADAGVAPRTWCDVGGATGRFLREIVAGVPSIGAATLLEPSEILSAWARRLLVGPPRSGPGGDTTGTVVPVPMPGNVLQPQTVHVPLARWPAPTPGVSVVTAPADSPALADVAFDAVSCLNVLDRVPDPRGLFRSIERLVAPGGLLLVACPFDFKEAFTPRDAWFTDLHDLVDGSRWTTVGSAELPYVFRQYDRRVNSYLTQVVALTRRAAVSDRRE